MLQQKRLSLWSTVPSSAPVFSSSEDEFGPDEIPPAFHSTSDMPAADLHTIDLSLYEMPGGKQHLAQAIGQASAVDGSFLVVNTGLDSNQIEAFFDKARNLERLAPSSSDGRGALSSLAADRTGYCHKDFMADDDASPNDHMQACINTFREEIVRKILHLLSIYLQLDGDYLWGLHTDARENRTGQDVFRFLRCRAPPGRFCLPPHSDGNTISFSFSQPALVQRLLCPDGGWRDVRHRDGALICNIGQQLALLTGGVFRPAVYRLLASATPPADVCRVGVVFFAHALGEVALEPLAESALVQRAGRRIFRPGQAPSVAQFERRKKGGSTPCG